MKSDDLKTITGAQIRAARALLRLSAEEVAAATQIGIATVRRAEGVDGAPAMTVANNIALKRHFQSAGVEFIEQNGGGPGVRLREPGE